MASSLIGHTMGQYQVVAELGRGQHSIVYKAWQQSLERFVALKVVRDSSAATLHKFQEEARLTAYLIQQWVPNIRQVYEVGQTSDGQLFVALEYVEDSLQSLLQRMARRNSRINPVAAARLLAPVAQALDAIHSLGYVHLDIKPQNILIVRGGRTVLADFGIAQRRGACTHACTPAYASPEQAAGDRPVGPWSDIYSLGVVLYEMVTGRRPFPGEHEIVLLRHHLETTPPSPRQANPRLTHQQERALSKALAKQARQRFRTAGALVQAMTEPETFISGAIDRPSQALRATGHWLRRVPRPLLIIAAGLSLALLLALLGLALWQHRPPPSSAATPASSVPALPAEGTAALTSTAATPTRAMATLTPSRTLPPTATLQPTPTRTPRPTATATRQQTPTLPEGSVEPTLPASATP